MFKKIFLVILAITLINPTVSDASDAERILFSESFSSFAENATDVATLETLSGVDTRVISDSGNKVLFSRAFGSRVYLKSNLPESLAQKFVVSASIRHSGKITKGKLFTAAFQGGKADLLTVQKDGSMTLPDGKIIGGIPRGRYRTVTIAVNCERKTCDVYMDKRCVVKNWKLSSPLITGVPRSIEWQIGADSDSESTLYIDNIRVYEGDTLPWRKSFPHQENNTEVLPFEESVDITDAAKIIKNADFTSGISDINAVQNAGTITHFDTGDGSGYARMYSDGSASGTSYFDVTDAALVSVTDYVAEAKIRIDDIGKDAYIRLFDTLDTKSGTWRTGYKIDSNGTITSLSDGMIIGKAKTGEWTKLSVVYDMVDFSAKVYVNGKCMATHGITQNYFPDMFRVEQVNAEGSISDIAVEYVRMYVGNRVVERN